MAVRAGADAPAPHAALGHARRQRDGDGGAAAPAAAPAARVGQPAQPALPGVWRAPQPQAGRCAWGVCVQGCSARPSARALQCALACCGLPASQPASTAIACPVHALSPPAPLYTVQLPEGHPSARWDSQGGADDGQQRLSRQASQAAQQEALLRQAHSWSSSQGLLQSVLPRPAAAPVVVAERPRPAAGRRHAASRGGGAAVTAGALWPTLDPHCGIFANKPNLCTPSQAHACAGNFVLSSELHLLPADRCAATQPSPARPTHLFVRVLIRTYAQVTHRFHRCRRSRSHATARGHTPHRASEPGHGRRAGGRRRHLRSTSLAACGHAGSAAQSCARGCDTAQGASAAARSAARRASSGVAPGYRALPAAP